MIDTGLLNDFNCEIYYHFSDLDSRSNVYKAISLNQMALPRTKKESESNQEFFSYGENFLLEPSQFSEF